jgi:hypothetical protein
MSSEETTVPSADDEKPQILALQFSNDILCKIQPKSEGFWSNQSRQRAEYFVPIENNETKKRKYSFNTSSFLG